MSHQQVVYAFIFARGGSKGINKKNIRLLAGKPLIAYSIELAKKLDTVKRIIVSTDDLEIAEVARQWGAEVPFMRPAEFASDNASEWLAWRHALQQVGCTLEGGPCDIFLSLPATAPLRSVGDVIKCIDTFNAHDCDAVITSSPAARHPMFNMVTEDESGEVHIAMPSCCGGYSRRQDAPALYDVTTAAYVVRPQYILTQDGLLNGHVRQVVLPRERAVDIDDETDLAYAEFLISRDVTA